MNGAGMDGDALPEESSPRANQADPERSSYQADPERSSYQPCEPEASGLDVNRMIDLERSQIGHEIHDALLPLIFAASANLSSLNVDAIAQADAKAATQIRHAQDFLRDAMQYGRQMLTQIYPPELERWPFVAAIKDAAERICESQCELIWHFAEDSPVCDSSWDREQAAATYRIIIEAIRNALRHGNASCIAVRCHHDHLVIVDDGDGFDPASVPSGHFGIRSMKGRAALVGYRLTVASASGGPTTVRVSFS